MSVSSFIVGLGVGVLVTGASFYIQRERIRGQWYFFYGQRPNSALRDNLPAYRLAAGKSVLSCAKMTRQGVAAGKFFKIMYGVVPPWAKPFAEHKQLLASDVVIMLWGVLLADDKTVNFLEKQKKKLQHKK